MSANRHLGRIVALQTLYEEDFRRECADKAFKLAKVLARNIERYRETIDDKAFIKQLVNGVAKHQSEIDDIIRPVAPEWPIEQIARIDRIVLRIGVYELLLAKAFGGDNSSKFINGVLGTVLRNKEASAAKPKAKKVTKVKKKAKSIEKT